MAFSETQRNLLLKRKKQLVDFVHRMAELLASKAVETETLRKITVVSNQLRTIIESIDNGILAVDNRGTVTHCNQIGANLIRRNRRDIIGKRISKIWAGSPILDVLKRGSGYDWREESYQAANHTMHFMVTGNIGKMGGASGGCIWDGLPVPECGGMDTADRPENPSIPEYCWPDAILEGENGGYPADIKAIYNVGGNYLSQGSDIKKNMRAFNKVEFAVCHEHFMTPTAGHCDVVLPATTFLEREDILFPGMNYLFYSGKAMDPPGNVKE